MKFHDCRGSLYATFPSMKSVTRWSDTVALTFWLNIRSKVSWSLSFLIAVAIAWDIVSPRLGQGAVICGDVPTVLRGARDFHGTDPAGDWARDSGREHKLPGPRQFTITTESFVEDDGRKKLWSIGKTFGASIRHVATYSFGSVGGSTWFFSQATSKASIDSLSITRRPWSPPDTKILHTCVSKYATCAGRSSVCTRR